MFTRLILSLAILSFATLTNAEVIKDNMTQMQRPASFDEDYFVALKAYEDGFISVAKLSFEQFLIKTPKSKESDFARYILYQIYLDEGNLTQADATISKIDNNKDERFDENKIISDRMSILVKTNCNDAKKFLLDNDKADLITYLKSDCKLDNDILLRMAEGDYPANEVLFMLNKIKDNATAMKYYYSLINLNTAKPEVLNYYGKYFALNNMSTEFYKLFAKYKDKDLVETALNMAWANGNLDAYISIFNSDVKDDYKMQPATYCRMIDVSNKLGKKYNCAIIDSCMQNAKAELNKTKISCLIKNEDKDNLNIFMSVISPKEAVSLCEFARYIMNKKLYNNNFIYRFNTCKDKQLLYLELVNHKDANAIITLSGIPKDQYDYAYLSYAYYLKNNTKEMNKYLAKVKDKNLLAEINKLIGR